MANGDWLFHLTPVVMMATILLINHTINGRRNRRRAGLEASRMATAVGVELQSMLNHYSDNLSLLARDAPILLSARGGGQVYRTSLPRMVGLLDERLVAMVVAAYAHHERIEALLVACSQPNSGFTLRAGAGGAYHEQLRQRFVTGCEVVEAAISALALAWPIGSAPDQSPGAADIRSTDVPVVSLGQMP